MFLWHCPLIVLWGFPVVSASWCQWPSCFFCFFSVKLHRLELSERTWKEKSAWNGMLPQRDKASAMWGNKSDHWDSCQGAWILSTDWIFPRHWLFNTSLEMHIAAAHVLNTLVMLVLCNLTLFDLYTTRQLTILDWIKLTFYVFRSNLSPEQKLSH